MEKLQEENSELRRKLHAVLLEVEDLKQQNHILKNKLSSYKQKMKAKEKEWTKYRHKRKALETKPTETSDEMKGKTVELKKCSVESAPSTHSYKYERVVLGKARLKLPGHTCLECRDFYASENMTKTELQAKLNQCSRHRAEHSPPPDTPDSFWDPNFPSTQECIDKGYILTEENCDFKEKKKKRKKYLTESEKQELD